MTKAAVDTFVAFTFLHSHSLGHKKGYYFILEYVLIQQLSNFLQTYLHSIVWLDVSVLWCQALVLRLHHTTFCMSMPGNEGGFIEAVLSLTGK